MSTMPLDYTTLSIVIPTYNRASLIVETIDSVLRQSTPFLEVIVVNDGSTDDTVQVLAHFGDRIRLINLPNGGVQNARNVGVAAAQGVYVVLCDSDDLLESEFSAVTKRWITENPECDALYSNFVTFDQAGCHQDKFALAPADFFKDAQQSGDFLHAIPDLYARTVEYQPLFLSGCTFRKEFYTAIGGFDTRFNNIGGEDWEFTLRVLAKGNVALCAKPLARIRKHNGNDSTDSMRQMCGTADILEFALANHSGAQPYRDIILRSIDARRIQAFDAAFARGAFDTASELLSRLRIMPKNPKFMLKAIITKLPRILRAPLWSFTQAS